MSLASILDAFTGLRAVVLGDLMLDEYIYGTATRISPEAPVMVVRQSSRSAVPGGAANVGHNIAAFGAGVDVIGLVGMDEAGRELASALAASGELSPYLIQDPSRATTRKTRVVANHSQQVLRIDEESTAAADPDREQEMLQALEARLPHAQALALSDYTKGCLTPRVVREAIRMASARGCRVSANAKPDTAALYQGADLVTLNRPETEALLGRAVSNLQEAEAAAEEARLRIGCHCVTATMGGQGLAAAWEGGSVQIPAPVVEVHDAAGAGDTVISALTLGLAAAGFQPDVFRLAVEASAKVVRRHGVVAPSPTDLAELRDLG